jgi:hypothetical protein
MINDHACEPCSNNGDLRIAAHCAYWHDAEAEEQDTTSYYICDHCLRDGADSDAYYYVASSTCSVCGNAGADETGICEHCDRDEIQRLTQPV